VEKKKGFREKLNGQWFPSLSSSSSSEEDLEAELRLV
jgi:hypothetical protein